MRAEKSGRERQSFVMLQAVLAVLAVAFPLSASAYDAFDAGLDVKVAIPSRAKTRSSNSPLTESGWEKYTAGDMNGAWKDFTQALAQNPKDAEALCGRAFICVSWRDYNYAIIEANDAVRFAPANLQTFWARGIVNYDTNQFAAARDDLKKVVAGSPDWATPHAYLGNAYFKLGDRRNAYDEFVTASKLYAISDPNKAKHFTYLANLVNPNFTGRDGDLPPPLISENLAKMYSGMPKIEKGRTIVQYVSKWPAGKTLTVAFNGGDPLLWQKIADTAPEWSKYGNIKFSFKDPATGQFRRWNTTDTKYSADIRIGFEKDGYWSMVGQQSITSKPPGKSSMNFDPTNWQNLGDYMHGTILHEFGHALGFLHEHQHPYAGGMTEVRWFDDPGYVPTKDNSGMYMADSQGRLPGLYTFNIQSIGWDAEMSYAQIAAYEDTTGLELGPLDTKSIMQYPQYQFLMKTGKASPAYAESNYVLSAADKVAVQKQYPGPTSSPAGRDLERQAVADQSPITIKRSPSEKIRSRGFYDDEAPAMEGTSNLELLGYQAYVSGDYQTAINEFTRAIGGDPSNVIAIKHRGNARSAVGDWVNALADFSMLRIAPMQADNLVDIGYCHLDMHDYPVALADFTNSLSQSDSKAVTVDAYSGRAAVKRSLEDIAGSIADCNAALQIKPTAFYPRWQRAKTYAAGLQIENAVSDLLICLEQRPSHADGHLLLAQCYQKLGQKANAISEYRKANYLYQQTHDQHGIEETDAALKILQANAGRRLT